MDAINYARMPGPGDFSPSDREDRIADRASQIKHEVENDPAKLAEIDEYLSQRLDGDVARQLFSAIADLHDVPAGRLLGSKELERLYWLAKQRSAEREERLSEYAYDEAEGEQLAREDRRRGWGSLRIATPEQVSGLWIGAED